MADGRARSTDAPTPPPALRAARRSIDGLAGVAGIGSWRWEAKARRWVLPLRLEVEHGSEYVPRFTNWFVLVAEPYPWGPIVIHPAVDGGIVATFQHQMRNDLVEGQLWRRGEICVAEQAAALGRWGGGREPFDDGRLAWRVRRALGWLTDAAAGTLGRDGDPFELPDFAPAGGVRVAAQSVALDCEVVTPAWGAAEVSRHADGALIIVHALRGRAGDLRHEFGVASQSQVLPAAWVRLTAVPVLPPWQAPMTYGEVRRCFRRDGLELDRIVSSLARGLQGDEPRIMLVGFPVPTVIEAEPERLTWQALLLPPIPPRRYPKARGQPVSLRPRPNPLPGDAVAVTWLGTEDWSDDVLRARGALPSAVTEQHLLLIGAGSLGSAIAEQLVKGGARNIAIVDPQILEGVNVGRHVLTLADVGRPKAPGLADHLREISPRVRVDAVVGSYPEDVRTVDPATVVIETTGDDHVLAELARDPRVSGCQVLSLSLDYGAHRVFCFASRAPAFPLALFRDVIGPWLEDDVQIDLSRRDAPGCWHPFWPGRFDHVAGLASVAVGFIERHLHGGTAGESELAVFERQPTGEIVRRSAP